MTTLLSRRQFVSDVDGVTTFNPSLTYRLMLISNMLYYAGKVKARSVKSWFCFSLLVACVLALVFFFHPAKNYSRFAFVY